MRTRLFGLCMGLLLLTTLRPACAAPIYVRFNTNLGNIDVELFEDTQMATVTNFLSYANSTNGPTFSYNNSIIHRIATVSNSGVGVIQGGGFFNYTTPANPTDDFPPTPISTNPAITGNPLASNTRGTIAMALSDIPNTNTTDPNSATSEWYFNVIDNTALDGTFTVFGTIMNASSLSVMDQISNVQTYTDGGANDGGALTEIPLLNFNPNDNIVASNYVTISSITTLTNVQDFPTWQNTYFSGQPAGNSAPTATPLNDGVPNLLKYAFDINPSIPMTAAARARLPIVGKTTISGTSYLTLTYYQHDALIGVTVNVQTSPDLQTWTTVANPVIVQTGTDSSTGDPILQAQVAATGTTQFIRLNVTMP